VNANTVQTISKKAGNVVTTQQSTVSATGRTRTVTTKGVLDGLSADSRTDLWPPGAEGNGAGRADVPG
jgi:hypothetical protein